MVYQFAFKYGYLLPEEERNLAYAACFTHDVIEDCRQTYNDVKSVCGETVAEMTYAVSTEKGKTRKERANLKYYNDMVLVKNSPYLKLCDRLANITYSKQTGSSMFDAYKKEHKDFVKNLSYFKPILKPMFDELDALFM